MKQSDKSGLQSKRTTAGGNRCGEYFLCETGNLTTTYYAAGLNKVAMPKDGDVYYFLGDHLESASATVDDSGIVVGMQMYTPFGCGTLLRNIY